MRFHQLVSRLASTAFLRVMLATYTPVFMTFWLAAPWVTFAQDKTTDSAAAEQFTLAQRSQLGRDGFVQRGDVQIHYVTAGTGPLLVMIHGFPDFWYTWRHQMPALSEHYQVVAIDQRGYNRSSQPTDVADYRMPELVADVAAVIEHFNQPEAIVVGHDWGGAVAWTLAMTRPELVERLIILNLPHLKGLQRELKNNPQQQAASAYARAFQIPGAEKTLSPELLARWVEDETARAEYVQALSRSSMSGMLNYYRANYPRPPYEALDVPPIKCPVLLIHGLKDTALLAPALNDTWEWIEADLTLVTVPSASHFVQHDASRFVTETMSDWLARQRKRQQAE